MQGIFNIHCFISVPQKPSGMGYLYFTYNEMGSKNVCCLPEVSLTEQQRRCQENEDLGLIGFEVWVRQKYSSPADS